MITFCLFVPLFFGWYQKLVLLFLRFWSFRYFLIFLLEDSSSDFEMLCCSVRITSFGLLLFDESQFPISVLVQKLAVFGFDAFIDNTLSLTSLWEGDNGLLIEILIGCVPIGVILLTSLFFLCALSINLMSITNFGDFNSEPLSRFWLFVYKYELWTELLLFYQFHF